MTAMASPSHRPSLKGRYLDRVADELHARVAGGATEEEAQEAIDVHLRAEAAQHGLGFTQPAMAVMMADHAAALTAIVTADVARNGRWEPLVRDMIDIARRDVTVREGELEFKREQLRADWSDRRVAWSTLARVAGSKGVVAALASAVTAIASGAAFKGCITIGGGP